MLFAKKKIAWHSALNVTSGIVRAGSGALSTIMLSRSWNQDEFGAWTFVVSVSTLIVSLDIGVSAYLSSLSKGFDQKLFLQERVRPIVLTMMALGLTLSIGTLFLSDVFLYFVGQGNGSHIANVIKSTAFSLVGARFIYTINIAILGSLGLYNLVLIATTAWSACILSINYMSIKSSASYIQNLGYQGWAYVVFACATLAVISNLSSSLNVSLWRPQRSDVSEILTQCRNSLLVFPTSLSANLFSSVDKIIVGTYLGFEKLAIYAVASMFASQINILSAMWMQPMVHFVKASNEISRQQMKNFQDMNIVVPLALSLVIIVLSPTLAYYSLPSLSNEFAQSRVASLSISLMALIYGLYSTGAFGYYYFLALERYKLVSGLVLIANAISIIMMILVGRWLRLTGIILCNSGYLIIVVLTFLAAKELSYSRLILPKKHIIYIAFFMLASLFIIGVRILTP
jgi:O-antigen/teichoic acid export membrane protein